MAIGMALTVFAGFAPTFYLRPAFSNRPTITGATSLTTLAQIHGVVFTLWVILFIVQTALVARQRLATHRRLGIAGGFLAATMVILGVITAIKAAARGSAPPGADALSFLIVPLTDMVLFPFFVTAALWLRRDKEAHKRLMVLAYVSMLAAATARLPGIGPLGPFAYFALAFVFILAGVVYDLLTRKRIHPVYIWGGLLLAASVPLRLMLSGTAVWKSFAEFLVAHVV